MTNRPFLPSDLSPEEPLRGFRSVLAIKCASALLNRGEQQVAAHLYGGRGEAILRAAVSPTTLGTGAPLSAGRSVIDAFLRSLAPMSAAAQLFTNPIGLSPGYTAVLPSAELGKAPTFVGEGQPIPVTGANLSSVVLGPPNKLPIIVAVSGELVRHSAIDAEGVIEQTVRAAGATALDTAVFSDVAASAIRPAGLFAGLTPVTAASGSGQSAMLKDVQALIAGISAAGGGVSTVLAANPVQVVALNALAANGVGFPVLSAPTLPLGTVAAVEALGVASAFAPDMEEISVSTQATIHFEDTNPAPISTAGTPNVVAAPVRSAFQTDSLIIRMILRCAWARRSTGLVQVVNGVNW